MGLLWLAVTWATVATPSGPELLARAERELSALQYTQAQATLSKLEGARGLDRRQAVRALALSARVKGSLGREAEAREAFIRLLEIEPGYALEGRASPKITGPFFEARALARPLRISLDAERAGAQWVSLKVKLQGPLERVKVLRLTLTEDGPPRELSLEVKAEQEVRVSAKAFKAAATIEDARAWVLIEEARAFEELALPPPMTPEPAITAVPAQDSPPPMVLVAAPREARFRPAAATLLAAGLVSGAVGLGLYVKAASSSAMLQQAVSMEVNGVLPLTRQAATGLNNDVRDFEVAAAVAWAVAGALLISALVVFFVGAP